MTGVIGNPTLREHLSVDASMLSNRMQANEEGIWQEDLGPLPVERLVQRVRIDEKVDDGWMVTFKYCVVPANVEKLTFYRTVPFWATDHNLYGKYLQVGETQVHFDVTLCRTFEDIEPQTRGQGDAAFYRVNGVCMPRAPVSPLLIFHPKESIILMRIDQINCHVNHLLALILTW